MIFFFKVPRHLQRNYLPLCIRGFTGDKSGTTRKRKRGTIGLCTSWSRTPSTLTPSSPPSSAPSLLEVVTETAVASPPPPPSLPVSVCTRLTSVRSGRPHPTEVGGDDHGSPDDGPGVQGKHLGLGHIRVQIVWSGDYRHCTDPSGRGRRTSGGKFGTREGHKVGTPSRFFGSYR